MMYINTLAVVKGSQGPPTSSSITDSYFRGYPEITLVVKGGGGVREKLIFTNRGGGRDTAKTNG